MSTTKQVTEYLFHNQVFEMSKNKFLGEAFVFTVFSLGNKNKYELVFYSDIIDGVQRITRINTQRGQRRLFSSFDSLSDQAKKWGISELTVCL